ncbi:MAG: glycosyltransferase family 4 protein [Polyangiaceae bacterium]|nr:glycosyltransferase family 4 protein [Polyangiaceae bacterium]
MTRVRVAHITTIDLSLRYLLLNQMLYLKERGFDVTGVSAPGPDVPFIEAQGIRHIAVPMTRSMTPIADARALIELMRLFRRERFDIVHTHTPKPGLLGQLAARAAGVPHIVNTIHGFYFHDRMKPATRRFYIAMEKIAALQSDAILSQNPEDVRTAVSVGICPSERIELLGNGIDLTRFRPDALSAEVITQHKSALGIPEDALVIGFVGRMVAEKGLLELFDAFRRVRLDHPTARLLLVGPVDEHKSDALGPDRAKEKGIADACIFTGMREQVEDMYALMDVFVLPSHREGFPRSVMEASAMGKPVVVTDIRGCRETVIDGATGLMVPVEDAGALSRAIGSLLDDAERRRELGERGVQLARERFDERKVFGIVEATYERLLRAS